MTFFKVIKDNQIIDAGSTFLKCNGKSQQISAFEAADHDNALSPQETV